MARYGFNDDDADDDQGDDQGGGQPSNAELITNICDMLNEKLGLSLPVNHITEDSFLRDLYMALHGHPGHDFGDADADEDEDEDEDATGDETGSDDDYSQDDASADDASADDQGAREELPVATMSSGRKSQQIRRPSAERGRQVAAEQLRTSRIEPNAALTRGQKQLSKPRKAKGTARQREILAEVKKVCRLA